MFKKYFLTVVVVLLVAFQLTDYTFAKQRAKTQRPIIQLNRNSKKYVRSEKQRKKIQQDLQKKFGISPFERTKSTQQKHTFESLFRENLRISPPQGPSKIKISKPRMLSKTFRSRYCYPENLSIKELFELRVDIEHARKQPSNLILIRNHRLEGRDVIHVHDRTNGFIIDKNFNICTKYGWKNLIKGGADKPRISDLNLDSRIKFIKREAYKQRILDSYLDFIGNASKTERLVTNEVSDINYVKLFTSKDALNKLGKSCAKLKERVKQIHSTEVGLVFFESIKIENENFDILTFCRSEGRPIIRTISPKTKNLEFLRKEIEVYDLEQKTTTKEVLVHDTGLFNRYRIREGLPNQGILFAKDIDLGIRNCNIRNNPETKISLSNIRVLNFLPRNQKQAKQANLSWNAEDVKIANEITRLVNDNLPKEQILTNKKLGLLERFLGKKESKVEILNKLADVAKQRTVDTVDILLVFGHKTNDKLHMPTGEKISVADYKNLSPNALKYTYVFHVTCGRALECNKSSFNEVFLKKKALGVTAPDKRIEVLDTLKTLDNVFKRLRNNNHFQINKFIREIKYELPELNEQLGVETHKLGLPPFYVPADIRELSFFTVVYC